MEDNENFDAEKVIKESIELVKRLKQSKDNPNSEVIKSISTTEHLEEMFNTGHRSKQ